MALALHRFRLAVFGLAAVLAGDDYEVPTPLLVRAVRVALGALASVARPLGTPEGRTLRLAAGLALPLMEPSKGRVFACPITGRREPRLGRTEIRVTMVALHRKGRVFACPTMGLRAGRTLRAEDRTLIVPLVSQSGRQTVPTLSSDKRGPSQLPDALRGREAHKDLNAVGLTGGRDLGNRVVLTAHYF